MNNRDRIGPWISYWTALSLILCMPHAIAADDKTKKLPPDGHEKLVPKELNGKTTPTGNQGWIPRLSVSTSISFAHSKRVVGAQDGQTWNIGPSIAMELDYIRGGHEWRNRFSIQEVFTRTPVIDEFVKTTDRAYFETLYLYHFESVPWLGPYTQFKAETSIFPGEDVRDKPTTYQIEGEPDTFEAMHVGLTQRFSPSRLKEIVGVFAAPIKTQPFELEFRLGVGGQQIWVRDGLVIEDKKTTTVVELRRMKDFQQIGAELVTGIRGTLIIDNLGRDRPLTYALSAGLMAPFYSNRRGDLSFSDLIGVEIDGKITVHLFEWAALDYVLRIVRAPLIVDDFQVQHNLLLSFAYTMSGSDEKKTSTPTATTP